jgi:hypothetical protein
MPLTRRLGSITSRAEGCWRENANKRCVRDAARSAAWTVDQPAQPHIRIAANALTQVLETAANDLQQVVAVMRDAAGELTNRFQFLCLGAAPLRRAASRRFHWRRALPVFRSDD